MTDKKNYPAERLEVIKSIDFSEKALEKPRQQVVKILDLINRDDLPKECYKNYIKGLAIIACFSKSPFLSKLITEKLCSIINSTNYLEKELPPRTVSNIDFSKNVKDNQANLQSLKKPYQQYYDENLNKKDVVIEESQENNYAFRELGLFRDISSSNLPPLPFRPFLIAEAIAFVAIYKQGAVGQNAFNFLSKAYLEKYKSNNNENSNDEIIYKSDSIKFSTARGLSQIIIHNNKTSPHLSKKAFDLLLSGLFSDNHNDRLISKEAIMRIAIEKPGEFFKNGVLSNIIEKLNEFPNNINEAVKIIEILIQKAPKKLKSADKLLEAIEISKKERNENWKYFDYFKNANLTGFPLAKDAIDILKFKDTKCLVIHNIRESLGDEWIREKHFLQALLDSNKDLQITIVTDKTFLYNHPRINALNIKNDDILNTLDKSKFSMVYNQFYENGAYSDEVQNFVVEKYRNKTPIYIETACESNFHDASVSFISLMKNNLRKIEIFSQKSLENLYTMTLKTCVHLGLPTHNLDKINILCANQYQPAEKWWKENILNKNYLKNRPVMVYNFGGGTFEDKGHTKFEIDVAAKEIVNAIDKGFSVVVLSATSEWNNHEIISKISELIPEDKQKFCIKNVPTPKEDSFLQFHIIRMSNCIKSVEGGVAHLAVSFLDKLTEIPIKNGVESGLWLSPLRKNISPPLLEYDLIKSLQKTICR
jgi:hypothetical protein